MSELLHITRDCYDCFEIGQEERRLCSMYEQCAVDKF